LTEYIEKEAAIDAVHGEFDECLVWDTSGLETANLVENILDTIQPADVRPVAHGKWIEKQDKDGKTYGVCSCCGYEQYAGHLKYCPECGGKMDGPNQ
jgi:hypothetical protein